MVGPGPILLCTQTPHLSSCGEDCLKGSAALVREVGREAREESRKFTDVVSSSKKPPNVPVCSGATNLHTVNLDVLGKTICAGTW